MESFSALGDDALRLKISDRKEVREMIGDHSFGLAVAQRICESMHTDTHRAFSGILDL
jgi:hypothetical protein